MFEEQQSRVAISICDNYSPDIIQSHLNSLLTLLGGLEQWVRPGMRVLLKPNLLSAASPERAVTTHPELVAAVAREVKKLGASVIIGDSPGGGKRDIDQVWEKTGFLAMAEREGLELVNFEASDPVNFKIDGRSYYLSRPAVEADLIISIPKLKTHVLTLMTGAVKNMFGLIPGFRKGRYHKEAPRPSAFAQILVDILSLKPPDLTIMDAVLAMEGDGPSSGTPRQLNLLLASSDPVALDAIAAEIIGLKAEDVPTTRIASDAGLGIGWPEAIEVLGHKVSDARCSDFKLTSNRKLEFLPTPLTKFLGKFIWVRPAIENSLCTACNLCADSCPTGAVLTSISNYPTFNYDLCINCWCCHEICPSKAVYIDQSWLAEKIVR